MRNQEHTTTSVSSPLLQGAGRHCIRCSGSNGTHDTDVSPAPAFGLPEEPIWAAAKSP